ncbi:hypothetical protein [Methylocystis sp. ATCC 49242]|uniref:hypothetical protein n=1 Tax=Methylocystis sp. ATCC 49242 TaxID=622637 RepID=UPI0001F870F5|nr:hypothetical protein [Methylocystis sp. ATCC 49242]
MTYKLFIQYNTSRPSQSPESYTIAVTLSEEAIHPLTHTGPVVNNRSTYVGVFDTLKDLFDASRTILGYKATLIELTDITGIRWGIIPTADLPKSQALRDTSVVMLASEGPHGVTYKYQLDV